jgi:hypothetical protein
MTLERTEVHGAWIAALTEEGLAEGTAQQLADSLVGDPRVAYHPVKSEADITELRALLGDIIDEYELDQLDGLRDHAATRGLLLETFDETVTERQGTGTGEESSGISGPAAPTGPGQTDHATKDAQRGYNTELPTDEGTDSETTGEGETITSASELQEIIDQADLTAEQLAVLIDQLEADLENRDG